MPHILQESASSISTVAKLLQAKSNAQGPEYTTAPNSNQQGASVQPSEEDLLKAATVATEATAAAADAAAGAASNGDDFQFEALASRSVNPKGINWNDSDSVTQFSYPQAAGDPGDAMDKDQPWPQRTLLSCLLRMDKDSTRPQCRDSACSEHSYSSMRSAFNNEGK